MCKNFTFAILFLPLYLTVTLSLTINTAYATTPSEMADMSLQELFALSTDDAISSEQSPWKIGFVYKQLQQKGYKKGSSNISNDEVLFSGPSIETRTDKNFPVLPKKITQQVVIANLSYTLDDSSNMSLSIPYIKQSTDHESIVPGFRAFNLSSDGVGDITLNYSHVFKHWDDQQLSFSLGLSAPTGSIDEEGDTPRAPGNQQLPFTMQIGSGTWDIPAGLSYQKNEPSFSWGGNLFTKIRLDKNDRDYRLGNRLALSGWSKWQLNETFQPFVKLIYQNWGKIDGRDDETTVPGAFPFPAGITNPQNFGGDKINAALGSDLTWNNNHFSLELSLPVYQSLNGIQPKEDFNVSVSWNSSFDLPQY